VQKNNGALDDLDEDGFFDLLSRFQSRRIDDQRCSFRLLESAPSAQAVKTNGKELAALGKTD
jgi:G-protein signaling modulator 2